jgi:hypothetical protein
MKKFGFATIVASGLAAAVLGLEAGDVPNEDLVRAEAMAVRAP